MKFTYRKCSVAFACAALVAIGAGTLGGCSSGGPTNVLSGVSGRLTSDRPTEVGSVSVYDVKVIFYSSTLNGKTEIGMRETGSAFAKRTVVAPLLAQGLTTQEIYLALAPKGATAPPSLVATQADEAAAMHRSADVRNVTVDTSALVEKDLSGCENDIFSASPPDGSEYAWAQYSAVQYYDQYGSDIDYPSQGPGCNETTGWVIMGGCNSYESPVSVEIGCGEQYSSCGNIYDIGETDLSPGYYTYWIWRNTGGAWYSVGQGYPFTQDALFDLVMGFEQYVGQ